MTVRLVGVSGNFTLPPIQSTSPNVRRKLLFVAGGDRDNPIPEHAESHSGE